MPNPMYIHGLHEPGGQHLMADTPGWILFLTNLSDGSSAPDFSPFANAGYGCIVRLNWGYGTTGTIPIPAQYDEFAQRCADYASQAQGADWFVVGNEINMPWDWAAGQPISIQDYVACYHKVLVAIRKVRPDALVAPAPVAPWNNLITYPGNENGDWVQLNADILNSCGRQSVDWICLHTYTHGPGQDLVTDTSKMAAPFSHRHYNFLTYRDFMEAIPAPFQDLPVHITESDQDDSWLNYNNGWVQAAYGEIDWWNKQSGNQQIWSLILYRWPDKDKYAIVTQPAIQDAFRSVAQKGYQRMKREVEPIQDVTMERIGFPLPQPRRLTRGWGANPEYYKRYSYGGVALRGHNGLDYGVVVGTGVFAVADGVVVEIRYDERGFGHYIKLKHDWGQSLYAHLHTAGVLHGDFVTEGQVIALSGNTGNSTGPHLHFAIRIDPYQRNDGWGGFSDPTAYMSIVPQEGKEIGMRKGEWIDKFNVKVITFADRPDLLGDAETVYVVKDIFTTRDGSWEPGDVKPGSLPQWARDSYLRPFGAPDYFDDAGGDHHLFGRVEDQEGNPLPEAQIVFWSDGLDKIGDKDYTGWVGQDTKPKSGWTNLVMYASSSYIPDRGECGSWSMMKGSAPSEVVTCMGMPNQWHVSTFVVFQAVPRSEFADVPPVVDPPVDGYPAGLPGVRQRAWDEVGVNYNPDAAFSRYASDNRLGIPLTNEFDINGMRAQGFVGGIVYAVIGDWADTNHLPW